ncbi:hypothetical protein XI08_06660 [Bradyrhizobium sp. CCBAU 11361]|nr:hypothetical protein [Bradyrhizobium sp. CCBAU 11361]
MVDARKIVLILRSDLTLDKQLAAEGPTWLDLSSRLVILRCSRALVLVPRCGPQAAKDVRLSV